MRENAMTFLSEQNWHTGNIGIMNIVTLIAILPVK